MLKSEWQQIYMNDIGWYGFDLDGTLAVYNGWQGAAVIGQPVPRMVERLKKYLAEGKKCKIMTARIWPIGTIYSTDPANAFRLQDASEAYVAVQNWCQEYVGQHLPITCSKDYGMIELFDDRCIQVEANTGKILEDELQELRTQLEKYKYGNID